jgi:hypothetical protein
MRAARFAYGQARVRARKSRLPGAGEAMAAPPPGAPADRRARFAALVADYAMVVRSFPAGRGLLGALVGLHEIENLKLGWRARLRGWPSERWTHLWRPLGGLAALRLEHWRDAGSLGEAVRMLAPPYAKVAAAVQAAHADRPADAELAFDRWATRRLFDEAAALGPREPIARELTWALVRERELQVVRRARAYAMSGDAAAGTTVLLAGELGLMPLRTLAAWTPADGPLFAALPPALLRRAGGRPLDWDELVTLLRRGRRALCARAFRTLPFHLGGALAFLLLREEEERSWTALAEAAGRPFPRAMERVLAAGPMAAGG